MAKDNNISGVILAGGTNSRFGGKIKANEVIGGEKIISRIIKTIGNIFSEIIIVTNTPQEFTQFSEYIITGDYFQKTGPLGGIHAAMKVSTREAVFVFAGDMPFINDELIYKQISYYHSCHTEAVIPEVEGMIEPLHGVFRNTLLERLETYLSLQKDYAIRDFIKDVDVNFFKLMPSPETTKAFFNINSPSGAEEALRLL